MRWFIFKNARVIQCWLNHPKFECNRFESRIKWRRPVAYFRKTRKIKQKIYIYRQSAHTNQMMLAIKINFMREREKISSKTLSCFAFFSLTVLFHFIYLFIFFFISIFSVVGSLVVFLSNFVEISSIYSFIFFSFF